MRRLGEELGVEAMSLYRHVKSKSDLLDGIYERILAGMELPRTSGAWDTDLAKLARAFRRVLAAHPKALILFATRPAVTPRALAYVELALVLLEEAGLVPRERLYTFQTIVTFIVGHALSSWGVAADVPDVRYEALSRLEFPRVSALGSLLTSHDVEAEFEFGLELLVTGLRQHVERAKRLGCA